MYEVLTDESQGNNQYSPFSSRRVINQWKYNFRTQLKRFFNSLLEVYFFALLPRLFWNSWSNMIIFDFTPYHKTSTAATDCSAKPKKCNIFTLNPHGINEHCFFKIFCCSWSFCRFNIVIFSHISISFYYLFFSYIPIS